jgi:HlyD family secretion protein
LLGGSTAYFATRVPAAPEPTDDEVNGGPASAGTSAPAGPTGRTALEAGGYIIPVHRVQVSPKVGGQVVGLFVEEGDVVEKGKEIARLDPAKYEYEFRRKKALAEQAKAKFDKLTTGYRKQEKKRAEAMLQEAREARLQLDDEVRRLRRSGLAASADELVKVESRLLQTEQKVIQLEQDHKMMQEGYRAEEVEEARAEYLRARAEEEDAKYDLDNTHVLAPVSGVVLVKRAEVGNTVLPNVPSNGLSASLLDMADLKELEVDVDVSERDLNRVFRDQDCEIRTEAAPDKPYVGKVSRLMPEANRSKACVPVRVRVTVPAGDAFLRPEMRARVLFLAPDKDKAKKG